MEQYEVNLAVEACDVDLDLLQKIDQHLIDEFEGSTIFTLSGNFGSQEKPKSVGRYKKKRQPENQSFDSVAEYDRAEIEDGTTSIVVERKEEGSDNFARLSLSSSPNKGMNQLLISLRDSDVNSRVQRIVQSIDALLNEQKAITRFAHTAFAYPLFVLFAVLPVGYLARDIIGEFDVLDASYSLVAATLYTFLCVFIIRQFIPFCVFDNRKNRRAKRIAGYVASGIGTVFVLIMLAGV